MGQNHSIARYSNDFELVIRATKELEHLLETKFGAPSGKDSGGLHNKISYVQQHYGLTQSSVKKMRYLVTIRNKLVHNVEFNKIPDRAAFAKSFDEVEKELKALWKKGNGTDTKCVIS